MRIISQKWSRCLMEWVCFAFSAEQRPAGTAPRGVRLLCRRHQNLTRLIARLSLVSFLFPQPVLHPDIRPYDRNSALSRCKWPAGRFRGAPTANAARQTQFPPRIGCELHFWPFASGQGSLSLLYQIRRGCGSRLEGEVPSGIRFACVVISRAMLSIHAVKMLQ
jgi:hypothetical protein